MKLHRVVKTIRNEIKKRNRVVSKMFKIPESREQLMTRMGDLSQLAGVKRYKLTEGRGSGVDAIDIETGSGLTFTVLPGRGMDIAWTKYKGIPISYISKTGIVSSSYYDPRGMGWLRSFFAGLLTTCGLSNAGTPSTDDYFLVGKMEHGLHGRISNTPAYAVTADSRWESDTCRIWASGTVRESSLHTENITLNRTFDTYLGAKSFTITDVITNEGWVVHPLMLLYHINIGYPIVDEGSRICLAADSIRSASPFSEEHIDKYALLEAPVLKSKETQYFFDLKANNDGFTMVAVVNEKLELAVWLKYKPTELPCFTEWKQMSAAEYVLGIEPGTSPPLGLENAKKTGQLEYLEPGQIKTITLEIGVADGIDEISDIEKQITGLM